MDHQPFTSNIATRQGWSWPRWNPPRNVGCSASSATTQRLKATCCSPKEHRTCALTPWKWRRGENRPKIAGGASGRAPREPPCAVTQACAAPGTTACTCPRPRAGSGGRAGAGAPASGGPETGEETSRGRRWRSPSSSATWHQWGP